MRKPPRANPSTGISGGDQPPRRKPSAGAVPPSRTAPSKKKEGARPAERSAEAKPTAKPKASKAETDRLLTPADLASFGEEPPKKKASKKLPVKSVEAASSAPVAASELAVNAEAPQAVAPAEAVAVPEVAPVEAEPAKVEPAEVPPAPAETDEAPAPAPTPAPSKAAVEPMASVVEARVETGPAPITFADLGLIEPIYRAVVELGFESPTPIQARAIPVLITGRDLMGLAQTGTGKTAAFGLPLLQQIEPGRHGVQALVLAPTRELAVQVAGSIVQFCKNMPVRVVPIYGGQPIDRQIRALQAGAQVVVGTPGRVLDHLRRGSLSLGTVKFCALDEADEMLNLGFYEDIETILAELPEKRQIAFFSATMPPRIALLTKKFLQNPEQITIEAKRRTVDTTNQSYYEVPKGKKMEALARVLDMETPGSTIVFCRTRQETNDLAEGLRLRGYNAEPLHGDMGQTERDRVMRRFREGQADLLIATDVAARGLDIDSVTHVINYDVPWDVEQYIHRVGRTGRAGRTGDAITLIEPRELRQLKNLERLIGAQIKRTRIPTAADVAARRREQFRDALREALQAGGFDGHLQTVEELSEEFDPSEIAAAALQILWKAQHGTEAEIADELASMGEQPEAGMQRIFIGMGRNEGLRPGDLVGAIVNEAGLSPQRIGAIDILDRTAFVEVPTPEVQKVLEALRGTKLRSRKPRIDVAIPEAAEAALANRGERGGGFRGDRGGDNRGGFGRDRGGPPRGRDRR